MQRRVSKDRVQFGDVDTSGVEPAAAAPAPSPAPAAEVLPAGPRGRVRRLTKENMLTKEHMLKGTDQHGVRIKIFTATLTGDRAEKVGVANFTYEGETIQTDNAGTKMEVFGGVAGRLRHGHGVIRYESGTVYDGQWQNDRRSGFGKMTFECGDTYEGQWQDGRYHGKGKYCSSSGGDEYDGEWKADKPHGFGRYWTRSSGDVFEGQWANGMREGKGKEITKNGDVYEGTWECDDLVAMALSQSQISSGVDARGKRIRMFTATLTCTRAFKAELAAFTYDGDSIPTEQPNTRLAGKLRHGQGSIRYDCGDAYEGQWSNDKRSGKGKYKYACGDTYDGEWLDGMYHGQGSYIGSLNGGGGDEYIGEWAADKPHGRGRYLYRETGATYEGDFAAGKPNGQGKYTTANGEVREGNWRDGDFVRS